MFGCPQLCADRAVLKNAHTCHVLQNKNHLQVPWQIYRHNEAELAPEHARFQFEKFTHPGKILFASLKGFRFINYSHTLCTTAVWYSMLWLVIAQKAFSWSDRWSISEHERKTECGLTPFQLRRGRLGGCQRKSKHCDARMFCESEETTKHYWQALMTESWVCDDQGLTLQHSLLVQVNVIGRDRQRVPSDWVIICIVWCALLKFDLRLRAKSVRTRHCSSWSLAFTACGFFEEFPQECFWKCSAKVQLKNPQTSPTPVMFVKCDLSPQCWASHLSLCVVLYAGWFDENGQPKRLVLQKSWWNVMVHSSSVTCQEWKIRNSLREKSLSCPCLQGIWRWRKQHLGHEQFALGFVFVKSIISKSSTRLPAEINSAHLIYILRTHLHW